MDKVRRPIPRFCYYYDPSIEGRIIAAPIAHVSLCDVTSSRQPLGHERMFIWCKQACRKVANGVWHCPTAFSTRGSDMAATPEACVANRIHRIDVGQRAHQPRRRHSLSAGRSERSGLNSGGYQTGYRKRSRQPGFHHSTNSGSGPSEVGRADAPVCIVAVSSADLVAGTMGVSNSLASERPNRGARRPAPLVPHRAVEGFWASPGLPSPPATAPRPPGGWQRPDPAPAPPATGSRALVPTGA
jgi:hypothetical protein